MTHLSLLRARMEALGVAGFMLPVADEYLGEYVPPASRRLEWLTGFSGSAGLVVVLAEQAAFFTDGRYTLQAAAELDTAQYHIFNSADVKPETWVREHLKAGAALGYDPHLHSMREVERWGKQVALSALAENPVDALWKDRPAPPQGAVRVHAMAHAGEESAAKRARVAQAIRQAGAESALLIASDSVNWLLNLRGEDLEFTPVLLAPAQAHASGATTLYVEPSRLAPEVRAHLENVDVRPPSALAENLKGRVLVDAALTPQVYAMQIRAAGGEVVTADDPCQAMKAVKNAAELAAMRSAHVHDGVAVSKFLCWLEGQKSVTELQVMERILAFRREGEGFLFPSFETIAGSGPNGAIVHYRSTAKTNRAVQPGELLLLDSGGQYAGGTTDITRTLAIGTPTQEMCVQFTRVLKGHIALASARFPEGTDGGQLDALARHYLWAEGYDFDHGTGHGVGAGLSVHEGPQRISKRGGGVALKPGMILSNEPGYYKAGAYGIRIENLVVVEVQGTMENGKPQLGFSTITCVPMDRNLVQVSMLSAEEHAWLNGYHAWVEKTLAPHMNADERAWLSKACAPML